LSSLPIISGRELVRAMRKLGYELDRQQGSHMVLRQVRAPFRRLVVPDHKEIAKGTLRAIVRQAGISIERLKSLL